MYRVCLRRQRNASRLDPGQTLVRGQTHAAIGVPVDGSGVPKRRPARGTPGHVTRRGTGYRVPQVVCGAQVSANTFCTG